MADDQGDQGTGQGLAERARQNAEANAYVTQRDHPSTPTEPKSNPYASTPQDKVTNQHPAPKGEKATYKEASDILKKSLKLYDKGGKVNVNDGKHEVAILKHGERVLTPEQNKDWEHAKNLGGVSGKAPTTLPIGGKDTRDANDVTPDMTPKKVYDKGGKVDIYKGLKDKAKPSVMPVNNATPALADKDTPGTSTSTGGATAHRNSGAATGGAVTVTISGSSSTSTSTKTSTATETSTTTGAGAKGKGASKDVGKGASATKEGSGSSDNNPDTGDKRPHVYNITINSTGKSGDAVDGGALPKADDSGADEAQDAPKPQVYDKGGKVNMGEYSGQEKSEFHRAMSHLHGGALHRHFGIPEDQPIPMAKKQEAANSDNPHVAKMGHMAVAMHSWKHGKAK